MKINELTNLWVGTNEIENFKVLIVAIDKEEAQEIANGYCLDSRMRGNFVIKEFSDVNENFDCDYALTNESNLEHEIEKDNTMSAEKLLEEIEKLEKEIMYEKERMKHCAYGKSDMYYLYGLEERLIELNAELAKAEEDEMEVEIMNEIKVTEEMKKELMDTYEGNKEMLYEMEELLNNNGYLDNGVSDIHETFEMGYNNALQYVFGVLGITDYEKVK